MANKSLEITERASSSHFLSSKGTILVQRINFMPADICAAHNVPFCLWSRVTDELIMHSFIGHDFLLYFT